jgi:branched-chain amino acid aminotransferase
MYYSEQTVLFFDGQYVKAADAKTDLYGQSMHYGYAIFEGIRAYETTTGDVVIFKAAAHYQRMKDSAEAVGIPLAYTVEELTEISYQVLSRNGLKNAYLRPLLFCPPNMSLQKAKASHLMIAAWEWGAYLGEQLLRVMTSSFQRPNPKAFKVHAKVSGHYVNSIMACQEAKDHGYDEALLLDANGFIAEGPGANVFFEKDGQLFTPALGNILPGITRATVIELATELGIPVVETACTPEALKQADSAFFCGTAAEVIGWKSIDEYVFPRPWHQSIGYQLQKAYKDLVLEKQSNTVQA